MITIRHNKGMQALRVGSPITVEMIIISNILFILPRKILNPVGARRLFGIEVLSSRDFYVFE